MAAKHSAKQMFELHPVILAGGTGSRMYPLTEECPKALLPVGNKPLIWYPIQLLEKNGFEEAIVVVRANDAKAVSSVLESLSIGAVKLRLTICEVANDYELGTADALRTLRGRIKKDVLLVSCDILTTVSLRRLWDIHVTQGCSLTMLLSRPPQEQPEDAAKKSISDNERDLIGVCEDGQVVYYSALADIENTLRLSKALLKRNPAFRLHSQLLDTHLYIVNKWILDYLHENKSIHSVKGELVPHLVRRHGMRTSMPSPQMAVIKGLVEATTDRIEQLALQNSSSLVSYQHLEQIVRCHSQTVSGELCMRVNTVPLYIEANRLIPQHLADLHLGRGETSSVAPPTKGKGVSGDSLLGDGVVLADRVSVKRSTIGHHCAIGDKSKIINCVIMDHVSIGEGCTLQGCVVCSHARIEDRVSLRDCIVGAYKTVEVESDHRGETLVEGSELTF